MYNTYGTIDRCYGNLREFFRYTVGECIEKCDFCAIIDSTINKNLLMKNRVLFFRENSIFRKLLFELQTVFEGFAHSFVYQIVAMCIWVECNGID